MEEGRREERGMKRGQEKCENKATFSVYISCCC